MRAHLSYLLKNTSPFTSIAQTTICLENWFSCGNSSMLQLLLELWWFPFALLSLKGYSSVWSNIHVTCSPFESPTFSSYPSKSTLSSEIQVPQRNPVTWNCLTDFPSCGLRTFHIHSSYLLHLLFIHKHCRVLCQALRVWGLFCVCCQRWVHSLLARRNSWTDAKVPEF